MQFVESNLMLILGFKTALVYLADLLLFNKVS